MLYKLSKQLTRRDFFRCRTLLVTVVYHKTIQFCIPWNKLCPHSGYHACFPFYSNRSSQTFALVDYNNSPSFHIFTYPHQAVGATCRIGFNPKHISDTDFVWKGHPVHTSEEFPSTFSKLQQTGLGYHSHLPHNATRSTLG